MRAAAISSSEARQREWRWEANALGSVTPLAISRTICIPVRPVMSVITLWRWTFIRARDCCIRRM